MSGSTEKLIPYLIPPKQQLIHRLPGDQDQLTFSPTPPIIRDSGSLILIPPSALSRDQCADGKWGSYLPHTSHHRDPPASRYPGLPSATLIRASVQSAKPENEQETFSMGFQTWATPPAFIGWCEREVLPVYGFTEFGLDACATPKNAKASRFLAPVGCDLGSALGCVGIDGLNASWANYGAVWCNPGFSECGKWLAKAVAERGQGVTSLVLTHATHTAGWYHQFKGLADRWLITPRINFLPPDGVTPSSNTRDSLLWVVSRKANGRIIEPTNWRK